MTDGNISGNNASSRGGGVYVDSGASVEMYGGANVAEISDNTAESQGGGVYVTGSGASFTMKNNSKISSNASTCGGGVYVGSGAFTMINGTITDNTASGKFGGGGVYVHVQNGAGSFNKTNGIIYGESNANTTSHTPGANTAVYSSNQGQNGHAVMLYFADDPDRTFFYRNRTLDSTDILNNTGLTWNSMNWADKGFEGVRYDG
jgi:predicted outer membrane repeat protein